MMDDDFVGTLKFKIKDGTTNSSKDLCQTCSNRFIRRGAIGSGEDLKMCKAFRDPQPVYGAIAECSGYFPANEPDLWNLKEIAWKIDTDKKTGKVGFISPKDWKRNSDD